MYPKIVVMVNSADKGHTVPGNGADYSHYHLLTQINTICAFIARIVFSSMCACVLCKRMRVRI